MYGWLDCLLEKMYRLKWILFWRRQNKFWWLINLCCFYWFSPGYILNVYAAPFNVRIFPKKFFSAFWFKRFVSNNLISSRVLCTWAYSDCRDFMFNLQNLETCIIFVMSFSFLKKLLRSNIFCKNCNWCYTPKAYLWLFLSITRWVEDIKQITEFFNNWNIFQ